MQRCEGHRRRLSSSPLFERSVERVLLCFLLVLCISLLACEPPAGDAQPRPVDAAPAKDGAEAGEPGGKIAQERTVVPRINVNELGRLPSFSHATTVGDLVFVSGTLGTKPQTIELVEGGVGPETAQIMDNISVILRAVGSSMQQLAKCIVYLTEMSDFAAMNEAWLEAVGPEPPARATIGVNELALGAVVEIECTAAR